MRIIPLTTSATFENESSTHCGGGSGERERDATKVHEVSLHRLKSPRLSAGTTSTSTSRKLLKGAGGRRSRVKPSASSNEQHIGFESDSRLRRQTQSQSQAQAEAISATAQSPRPADDVDRPQITLPIRTPLPRFHSRQCVPNRQEPQLRCPSLDRNSQSPADRHLVDCPTPRSVASAMALKFLSSHSTAGGTSSAVKYFDIRLDNDYIVFRGNEDEAASAQLAGCLVLCLTEPMNVSHIDLTLSGILHMTWQTSSTSSMSGRRNAYKEQTFFEKTWPFRVSGKNKTEILQPDNYEWPFDCILEGALPESVEGLKDAWVIYRLKAEIGRKRAKDIVVRKPLRIVRSLDPSALELAHAMSVENIWPNKIEYSISIPSKAVIFGSFLQVDFKLIPLLKGLVVGNVSTQLKEEQEFIVDPEWGVTALGGGQTKSERTIVLDNYTIDAEHDEQIIDEAVEGFQFTRYLELPKTLNKCLQDCNVKGIKIRHKVKFNVQLHNPDGHISELRANLPVSLYISPHLPINENNDLVDQSPQAGRAAIQNDMHHSAPPVYGEHTLDKLYSEMDPSGYLTPGMALSTPGTPFLHSRTTSSENLRSLGAIANGSGSNTPNGTFVSPAALQRRLQNLDIAGPSDSGQDDFDPQAHLASNEISRNSSAHNIRGDYFASHESSGPYTNHQTSPGEVGSQSGGATQPGSVAISRRASEEDDAHHSGTRTPFAQYDHMEDLAKVPSYSTAVKTPLPRHTPYGSSSDLPSYRAVTDPSPPPLAEPPSAHLRTPRGSLIGTSPPENGINGGRTPPTATNRNLSSLQDEERRLRVMQMRSR